MTSAHPARAWIDRAASHAAGADGELRRECRELAREARAAGVRSREDALGAARSRRVPVGLRSRLIWLLARAEEGIEAEPLERWLRDRSPTVRAEAARALAGGSSRGAAARLIRLLRADPSESVRVAAAHGLGVVGDAAGEAALRETLRDETASARLRGFAAESLAHVGARRESIDALIAALEAGPATVGYWAAFALGELRARRAAPALRRAVERGPEALAAEARSALARLEHRRTG